MSGEKTLNIWHPRSHKAMEKKEKERIEKEEMKLQEEERNNQLIVQNEENLKDDGVGVIDFFNIHNVKKNLIEQENIIRDNINFNISRKTKDKLVEKNISFEDNSIQYSYKETVNGLNLNDVSGLTFIDSGYFQNNSSHVGTIILPLNLSVLAILSHAKQQKTSQGTLGTQGYTSICISFLRQAVCANWGDPAHHW